MTKNYEKYKNCLFSISIDTKYKKTIDSGETEYKYYKKYYGFNKLIDYELYCKKQKHIYQLINSKWIKMFWDIDMNDMDNKCMTENELQTLLQTIKQSIYECFDITIDMKDFIVEHTKHNPYQSLHIYIDNYKVLNDKCNSDIRDLNKYIMTNYRDKIVCDFDNSVYSRYRQFKLVNMIKMKDLDNGKMDKQMISHKDSVDKSFSSRLICFNDYCKKINMNEKIKQSIIQSKIKELEDNEKQIQEIVKNGNVKIIDSISIDLIYDLMNDLSLDYYKKHNDKKKFIWINTTTFIIKQLELLDLSKEDKQNIINDWINKSSDLSNECYSVEDNELFIKNIDMNRLDKYNYNIHKFIRDCNNYLEYDLSVRRNEFDIHTINYIHNISKINKNDIIECIENYKNEEIKEKSIQFNTNTLWIVKDRVLIHNEKMYNYNENSYIQRIEQNEYEIQYDNVITDINDMEKYNDMLVNEEIQNLIYKGKWGTGKSYYGMRLIIDKMIKLNEDCSILIITENNTLNSEVYRKYKQFGFVSHTSKKCEYDNNRYICSLESSINIDCYSYDLVILDEFETIISQYESEKTINNVSHKVDNPYNHTTNYLNYCNLMKIVCGCDRLLIMDADISKNRIDWIKEKRTGTYQSVYIDINNFSDSKFYDYYDKKVFNDCMLKCIEDKEKILISGCRKSTIKTYYRQLVDSNRLWNDRVILMINGEGGQIDIRVKDCNGNYISKQYEYNGKVLDKEQLKELVKENVEKFLVDNKVDIFIYSPSVKTGLSINEEYFDKHFSIGECGGVNVRIYNQMLFRARRVKEFHIYITGNYKLDSYTYQNGDLVKCKNIDLDRMKKVFKCIDYVNKQKHKSISNVFNVNSEDMEHIKNDNHYFHMRMNNKLEDFNSLIYFKQIFITKLKLIHKLNHIYKLRNDIEETDMTKRLIDTNKLLKQEYLELLVNTPLIRHNEYNDIQEIVEQNKKNPYNKDTISDSDWIKRTKYEFLYGGFIKDTENNLRYTGYYQFKQLQKLYNFNIHNNWIWNTEMTIFSGYYELEDYEMYDKHIIKYTNLLKNRMWLNGGYMETNWEGDNKKVDLLEYVYNKRIITSGTYHKDTDYECVEYGCVYYNKKLDKLVLLMNVRDIQDRIDMLYMYDKMKSKYNELMYEYETINNVDFYDKWISNENKKKYKNCCMVLNPYEKQLVKVSSENSYENDSSEDNEEEEKHLIILKSQEEEINRLYVKEMLECLEVKDLRNQYTYKNIDLLKIIGNHYDKLLELDNNYIKNMELLGNECMKYNDFRSELKQYLNKKDKLIWSNICKKYTKIIIYMNNILNKVNIVIRHLDKNTSRDSGKVRIGFNKNHMYNSSVEQSKLIKQLDMKCYTDNEYKHIQEIKKKKKGFIDNNNNPVYQYKTSQYVENNTINDIVFDIVDNKLVMDIDIGYDKIGENDIYKRYKTKHKKNMIKKKDYDNDLEHLKSIQFNRYINLVEDYSDSRLDNLNKINSYISPLKEEILDYIYDTKNPYIQKIEKIENMTECMIE